jgi:hypothetical protein
MELLALETSWRQDRERGDRPAHRTVHRKRAGAQFMAARKTGGSTWLFRRYTNPLKGGFMRFQFIVMAGLGALALAACSKQEKVAVAPPPPPGAVAGSTAADRDGDGIVDGYYTADGIYHANAVPSAPPPPAPTRMGERG